MKNKEVDYTNNYPYDYEGYNDYEFRNENTKFCFKYPKNWTVKEIKRWSGDETREGSPNLGGIEIYLDADSERLILDVYSAVSHLHGIPNRHFKQVDSIIVDNEKVADIWMDTVAEDHVDMFVTYRDPYEGATLFLEKDIFNKYKKEIYTILSSIRFYDDLN